jgi:hypothetical protein
MEKISQIVNKLLVYKNYRIFVLAFYSIITILIYLNWNYLFEIWIEGFIVINAQFEEPLSFLILIYYFIFSFYGALSLFYPLTILDKKYVRDHKLKIKYPKLNRKNLFIVLENLLLLLGFPFLAVLGLIIWYIISYSVLTISVIGLLLLLVFIIFLLFYMLIRLTKKILRL